VSARVQQQINAKISGKHEVTFNLRGTVLSSRLFTGTAAAGRGSGGRGPVL